MTTKPLCPRNWQCHVGFGFISTRIIVQDGLVIENEQNGTKVTFHTKDLGDLIDLLNDLLASRNRYGERSEV